MILLNVINKIWTVNSMSENNFFELWAKLWFRLMKTTILKKNLIKRTKIIEYGGF